MNDSQLMQPLRVVRAGQGAAKAAGTAAVTVEIGAVACGVCCVLPFALPAVVVATAGGTLAWFGQAFWGALYLAVALVTGAWLWVGVESLRTKKKPARATLRMMVLATAVLALAAVWPTLEPHIISALKETAR